MLNPESPIPLYFQLAQELESRIESGDYKEGSRLPSENDLSGSYGIGRPTVRQALDLLSRKGFLVRRKGSGTYVEGPRRPVNLFSMAGTSSAFLKEGIDIERKICSGPCFRDVKQAGNPLKGKRAYCLSRLSLYEGEPVLLEDIYIDPDFFRGIEKYDPGSRPLSKIIEDEFFMKPSGGRQSFGADSCGGEKAVLLRIEKKSPVLTVKRELYFRGRSGVFYTEIFCRTDRFEFYQDLGEVHDQI